MSKHRSPYCCSRFSAFSHTDLDDLAADARDRAFDALADVTWCVMVMDETIRMLLKSSNGATEPVLRRWHSQNKPAASGGFHL
jgi:hypothetical protein